MNKKAFGIIAALALVAVCLAAPAMAVDGEGQIYHEGQNVLKVGASGDFEIVYNLDEETDEDITFVAKVVDKAGNAQSNAVSPSTGTVENGVFKTLSVTAPSTAGEYTLKVEFKLVDKVVGESEYKFKAVEPKTLTVNLKAEKVTLDMASFGVFFIIDGEKMDDSYTTVSLSKAGTGSVSYDWIADPAPGEHTFCVIPAGSIGAIEGLDEVHTFFVGDNDYSLAIGIAVVILILLIVELIRVYRKPIKNYGKPKSRR